MAYLKKTGSIAILLLLIYSCTNSSQNNWISTVSKETSFVIIPSQGATIQSTLQSELIPFLEDVTSSAIPLVSQVDSTADESLSLKSILLYPGANQKLQPIWITGPADDLIEKLRSKYVRAFAQNEYEFYGTPILNLRIENRPFFVAQIDDLLLLSESSLGIEKSIRAHRGMDPTANLSNLDLQPESLVINTPSLEKWVVQLARVMYGPSIRDAFKGTEPAILSLSEIGSEEDKQLQFSGTIPLSGEESSPLIKALSNQAKPITLDEYISSKAAAYGIFHVQPKETFERSIPDTTNTDAFLLNDMTEYVQLANAMDSELGLVMYTESGFLTTGEHLYLRKLKAPQTVRNVLEGLSTRNLIEKVEDLYFVQSYILSELIGSPLSNFKDFYIKIIGDAAVISKRRGLAEMVDSDRNRRRVITYEQSYKEIRETLPENVSSLFVTGPEFTSFLQPFLETENYVEALTSTHNYIALTTQADESQEQLELTITTFNSQQNNNPFRENWRVSTSGAELSGKPVFGNVGGSFNDEVVFATKTGSVYVVAMDGSLVTQFNTGSDVPIGPPVIFDWYGTGQNVVMIAAGNKIYGWDYNGDLLPKFPFELDERISTPLTVADLNNNKLPDAIVGTIDRKLHVLNGRGNNLTGWPVTTNAPINTTPLVDYFKGASAVIAFSSNAVHAWNAAGRPLNNFPTFVNATLKGSPVVFEDHILGNGVDGNLYSIGTQPQFPDSLNVSNSSSQNVRAVYASNGSLAGTPSINENMILTTSANGSVFLFGSQGQLRHTESMGQPSASNWSSVITDIDSDGSSDIIALANYGRLYAWNIENGERIFDLPTTGMSHVSITDLDGDGLKEVIAQTQDGVQSWTINRQ